jgi:hypothetical protein
MSPLVNNLSVGELARRCRLEAEKFVAGRACDGVYGLELFRRAIFQQDEAAWHAFYTQYQRLVAYWVQQHSKYRSSGEEVGYFVNAAFVRLWASVSRRRMQVQFHSLSGLLRYLKFCTYSAIEDECRRWQHWRRTAVALDDGWEMLVDQVPSAEVGVIGRAASESLMRSLLRRLQGEEEEVVAVLSWMHGLQPQEIQARRPDLFADATRIYQIKRNIVNRLARDPMIQRLRAGN